MADGRPEQGIASLIEIAGVVLHEAAQLPIRRAAGLLGVSQCKLRLADRECDVCIREQTAIGTALFGYNRPKTVIVGRDMLITQTSAKLNLSDSPFVGKEARRHLFFDVVVGRWHELL